MTTVTWHLPEIASDVVPAYAALRQAAEMYADHQQQRIVTGNRIRSLTVDVADYSPYVDAMGRLEKDLSRRLVALYRSVVPIGVVEWQESTLGVGEHMLARLLGHLGHPRLATPKHWARNTTLGEGEFGDAENPKRMLVDGEPYIRSVSQLWQFCGHGAPARRRQGMTQEEAFALGNPKCKMLVHLIAEGVVKAQVRTVDGRKVALGPLGQLYLDTRDAYSDRGHNGPCPGGYANIGGRVGRVRCKVDGRYAEDGDPFQPSHINAISLRRLGKQILADLYDAAQEEWC